MASHDQQQALSAPPVTAYPPPAQAQSYPLPQPQVEGYTQYVAPPTPIGYPQHHAHPVETTSRGDGFWKGCAAALCCCCVFDMCCL